MFYDSELNGSVIPTSAQDLLQADHLLLICTEPYDRQHRDKVQFRPFPSWHPPQHDGSPDSAMTRRRYAIPSTD